MVAMRLILLTLGAFFIHECSSVIWEPKESSSGRRGRGQVTPQVFELEARGHIQTELQKLAKQATDKFYLQNRYAESLFKLIQKRQAEEPDISTAATLTNDSHFHAIVHWTGYPQENIFILTRQVVNSLSEESWLWRSTDYGKTFINETSKLNGSIIQLYYVSSNTSYLIFADVIDKKLQITEDYGETYTSSAISFTPSRLLFQSKFAPNVTNFNRYFLGYDAINETLWVTADLGYTWTKIGDNVPPNRYYWRRLGSDIEGDLSTVYFEQRTSQSSNMSMLYFATFPYTTVQLFSPTLGEFQSGSFVLAQEYMFVQKPGSAANSNITYSSPMWVSYRRANKFKQALFPFLPDALEHLHYSVVDASEGLVFAAVYHDINTTNLYTSDVTGTRYSLSVKYIAGPPREDWTTINPVFDVHMVEGIVGTVLVNQKVPGKDFGSTLISHNKGGIWSPLHPPAVSANNQPLLCSPPDCSLHLRMESDVTNGYQSILSQETAVGLLMAVGNTGRNLSSSGSNSRVYLSRDGGFTWAEIEFGRWEFQYLALGSIIVMVKKQALVNSVKWSCDEGATWRTSALEDRNNRIVIIGMRTEIGEKPRMVSLFGLDYFEFLNDNFEWIIFTLNFTSVVPTQCSIDDYFDWVPTDERPYGDCLLGEMVTYERRNSSACCYVDPDYQKPTNISQCPCSIEDYECDFGFERLSVNAPCTPVPGYTYPPAAPLDCPEGENYTYSTGYRKIPGDKCIQNGVDISLPITQVCPIRIARGVIGFSTQISVIQPGDTVTFTFVQTEGSDKSTVYQWNFGDSTPTAVFTGLDSARSLPHSFARPGVFVVTLNTSNEAGTFETTTTVFVLDSLTEFSVSYPSEIVEDSVPVGFYIEFSANVVTQYKTMILKRRAPFKLFWNFGDGTTVNSSQLAVGHIYTSSGNFTVSTSVEAKYSRTEKFLQKMIRTYQAARRVTITSDGLIRMESRNFTEVQRSVMFLVVAPSGTEIPPQTEYTWTVQGPMGRTVTSNEEMLTYNFPMFGEYLISVTGEYLSTGSFFGSMSVSALSNITQVVVTTMPTVRLGSLLSLRLSLLAKDGSPYMGPVTVNIEDADGARLTTHSTIIMNANDAVIDLSFSLKQKGSYDIDVYAFNDISEVRKSVKIVLVDSEEYGALSILFDTEGLPKGYRDPAWQERLISSLTKFMATKFKHESSLFEVEGISTEANTNLVIDVNILPAAYSKIEIQKALKMVEAVVANVANKTFIFSVNGVSLTARYAYDRNKASGEPLPSPNQSNSSLDIALAIVIVAIVLIGIVVLVIVVYFCHSRYKKLQGKYSHLEETAGGNLAFNDTFENELISKEKEID